MKNLNFISKLLIFIGCAVILGTAGASDLGTITFKGILSGIILGIVLVISGKIGLFLHKTERRKNLLYRKTLSHSNKTYANKRLQKLPRKRPFAA